MNQISLERFSKPQKAIIPLFDGKGIYKSRTINLSVPFEGYYQVLLGDEVTNITKADNIDTDLMLNKLPLMRGIAYSNSIIPLNFDQSKFLGYEETIPVNFMNADLGLIIKTRRWEDGKILFHEIDYGSEMQLSIVGVKERAEKGEKLDGLKGITPEMRYFYLMVFLDIQRIAEWKKLEELELSRKEKEKRIEEFKASFSGRLNTAIEGAGGTLVKFNVRGNRVDLVWKVGREEFHSTLNQDFRVLELGFCADGHDKDHSISSAILLAKQFIEDGSIYKTRE